MIDNYLVCAVVCVSFSNVTTTISRIIFGEFVPVEELSQPSRLKKSVKIESDFNVKETHRLLASCKGKHPRNLFTMVQSFVFLSSSAASISAENAARLDVVRLTACRAIM